MIQSFVNSGCREDGLKVLIISGVHGNETHSIDVAYELFNRAGELTDVRKIDFIFAANKYGLEKNTRENGYKETVPTDCNRLFPKEYKTPEQLQEYLKGLIGEHHLVLDIHNSPMCLPCVLIDFDDKADYLLRYCYNTRLLPLVRATQIGTIKKLFNSYYATDAFTVELPYMGLNNANINGVDYIIDFIEQYQKQCKHAPSKNARDYLTQSLYTQTDGGIIKYKREIPIGSYNEGELICKVIKFNSGREEFICAPYEGILYDVDDNLYSYSGKAFGIYGKAVQ